MTQLTTKMQTRPTEMLKSFISPSGGSMSARKGPGAPQGSSLPGSSTGPAARILELPHSGGSQIMNPIHAAAGAHRPAAPTAARPPAQATSTELEGSPEAKDFTNPIKSAQHAGTPTFEPHPKQQATPSPFTVPAAAQSNGPPPAANAPQVSLPSGGPSAFAAYPGSSTPGASEQPQPQPPTQLSQVRPPAAPIQPPQARQAPPLPPQLLQQRASGRGYHPPQAADDVPGDDAAAAAAAASAQRERQEAAHAAAPPNMAALPPHVLTTFGSLDSSASSLPLLGVHSAPI